MGIEEIWEFGICMRPGGLVGFSPPLLSSLEILCICEGKGEYCIDLLYMEKNRNRIGVSA